MISSVHRSTVIRVNLKAISKNIKQISEHLPEHVKRYAVVKANAYGHGAVAVARHLANEVDGFCVSNIDEALELREAGITLPILILGVVMPEYVPVALTHQLTLTVASNEWLTLALKQNIPLAGLSVHIKLDTGMGRIGLRDADETNALLKGLATQGVNVSGIYTHFATADEKDQSLFNNQLAHFKTHLAALDYVPECVHASNSATTLWHLDGIFGAVRIGLAMYGLNPSGGDLALPYPLLPSLRLESSLTHVKQVEVGATVGYGATYTTKEPEIIGTVSIGYADGWTRNMQGSQVLVNGERCPIVGRVSMDQLTIRLPKVYPIGTPVVLIGNDRGDCITTTDIAVHRGTINYEVLCLLSDRIPRLYLED